MTRDATRYSGALVARGVGLSMHLGWFADDPDASLDVGQARLDELVLEAAELPTTSHDGAPRLAVLDVACGLGGTLARVAGTCDASLVGLDLGEGQLTKAREAAWTRAADVRFVRGDACALPFDDAAFDRVLCVEAAFHFASRARFLAEAARVLGPGGRLVVTDVVAPESLPGVGLANPPGDADVDTAVRALHAHLGPWPDPFCAEGNLPELAAAAGLRVVLARDLSDGTQPSYERFLGPGRTPAWPPPAGASAMEQGVCALGWLQASGRLRVGLFVFAHDQR